ncbi:MAG: hypothetical protein LBE62_15370 [Azonexus sp.]|jgi:Na+/proline symporter|nr:hypothetical protein [Azonexus sp.]
MEDVIFGLFVYGAFFALVILALANRVLTFKAKNNPDLLKASMVIKQINKYIEWFLIAFILAAIISLFDVLDRFGML